jgi:hypothetical protein
MMLSGPPDSQVLPRDLAYLEYAGRNANRFWFTHWRTGRVISVVFDCTYELVEEA